MNNLLIEEDIKNLRNVIADLEYILKKQNLKAIPDKFASSADVVTLISGDVTCLKVSTAYSDYVNGLKIQLDEARVCMDTYRKERDTANKSLEHKSEVLKLNEGAMQGLSNSYLEVELRNANQKETIKTLEKDIVGLLNSRNALEQKNISLHQELSNLRPDAEHFRNLRKLFN